jgi:type II secretory pathway pseudopilin PulG
VCSVIDGTVAILEAGGPLAIADALYGAVLTAAGILLPRFALRHLALGVFGQEASTEGFRDRRGRQLMANAGVGLLLAGALMTIAVPNFLTFALRAKASETRGQIEAIRAAQERWYAEHGHYRASGPYPAGPPGLQRSEFDPVSHAASGFDQLGWPEEPDVSLYCRYAVNAPGPPQAADAYTIEAVCDLDGDGEWMAFGWVKPGPGENTGVAGPFGFCSVRGVVSRRGSTSTERVLDRYGPCDSTSSVSHF